MFMNRDWNPAGGGDAGTALLKKPAGSILHTNDAFLMRIKR